MLSMIFLLLLLISIAVPIMLDGVIRKKIESIVIRRIVEIAIGLIILF